MESDQHPSQAAKCDYHEFVSAARRFNTRWLSWTESTARHWSLPFDGDGERDMIELELLSSASMQPAQPFERIRTQRR
jgi:hypothetical protein